MSRVHWWDDTVTIQADVADIINQIPTEELKLELEKRNKLKEKDEAAFKKEERYRTETIDIDICPDNYDLVDKEDIKLTDYFDDIDLINHLEDNGFAVVSKDETFGDIENVTSYLYNLPKYKFKEFICNVLGVSQVSTKEEIINDLKDRL